MQERRLAAIMFTDIAGYTILMGKDEERAFELLRRNRAIHNNLIKKYSGTLVKEMGDGMLVSFQLPSDAVRCALELREATEEEEIPLKIGIHEGEMVFEGTDVLGDGVNVASRLQEIAKEGKIYISDSVNNAVKNKAGIMTRSLGEKKLKNVTQPLKVFEVMGRENIVETSAVKSPSKRPKGYLMAVLVVTVVIVAAGIWIYRSLSASSAIAEKEKSILILPFDYEGMEEDNRYFVNGMMEDIRNNLSKIEELLVISKTTSEKYRNTDLTIPEIADELGVSFVLEGTVTILNDQVRIHAQLIDGATDDHIWADNYFRDLADVFGVQSEIAMNIARELYASITEEEEKIIETIPTSSLEALNYYNRGRFYHEAYWLEGEGVLGLGILSIQSEDIANLERAMDYYREALQADPFYAQAYTGLALALAQKYGETPYWEEYIKDTVLYLTDKALAINDLLDEAYLLRGIYYRNVGSQIDLAIENLKMAVQINPNYAAAYLELGSIYLWEIVDTIEGLEYLFKAYELDKSYLLPLTLDGLSTGYMNAGFYREAESYIKELSDLNTDGTDYLNDMAFLEWCRGDIRSGLNYALRVLDTDSLNRWAIRFLTYRYSYAGDIEKSIQFFRKHVQMADSAVLKSRAYAHRVGYILYEMGKTEEAGKYFDLEIQLCREDIKRQELSASRGFVYYDLFAVYAFLEQYDEAFDALGKLDEQWDFYPSWLMTYFKIDPLHEKVRDDPRYKDFLILADLKFQREHQRVKAWMEDNKERQSSAAQGS